MAKIVVAGLATVLLLSMYLVISSQDQIKEMAQDIQIKANQKLQEAQKMFDKQQETKKQQEKQQQKEQAIKQQQEEQDKKQQKEEQDKKQQKQKEELTRKQQYQKQKEEQAKKYQESMDEQILDSYHHWKILHNKQFGAEQNQDLFNAYKLNYRLVHKHNIQNQENGDLQLELNEFADMSNKEFKAIYHGYQHSQAKNEIQLIESDIPDSLDWREKGAVTKVKNQGKCGSCWAFSTTGALEGLNFIKNGILKEFSQQQLVDCSTKNNGCHGGLMDNAFKYVEEKGIASESEYPYKAFQNQCQIPSQASLFKISNFADVPKNSNKQLLLALNKGPVSVAIDAETSYFQLYKSGIFQQQCGNNLDHGVLLVGYGEENGVKYFTIKNSWGPEWGENGYIRLFRNENDDAGLCGIRMSASYPEQEQKFVTQ